MQKTLERLHWLFSKARRGKVQSHTTASSSEQERIMKGLCALRDAVHNLPFYLNLTHSEDAEFCHLAFSHAQRLLGGPALCGFQLTDEQCARLRGRAALSGAPLCDDDFKMSAQGDVVAALRIARVILWIDRRRFMTESDWHTQV